MALICDTGPLYASIDRSDKDHGVCAKLLLDADEELLVPAPVLVELEWLVSSRLGAAVFDSVFESIEDGTLLVEPILEADYARARQLCRRYEELKLGLVDAAVLAVTERLGEPKVATLDHRHFSVVKLRHVKALQLLP
jgi:uncharacterized protein